MQLQGGGEETCSIVMYCVGCTDILRAQALVLALRIENFLPTLNYSQS